MHVKRVKSEGGTGGVEYLVHGTEEAENIEKC